MHCQTIRKFFLQNVVYQRGFDENNNSFQSNEKLSQNKYVFSVSRENISKTKDVRKILQFHLWKDTRTSTLLTESQNLFFWVGEFEKGNQTKTLIDKLVKNKMFFY